MKKTFVFLIMFSVLSIVSAQSVTIVLKNSKVVQGIVKTDNSDYILINNDTGELKINKLLIESITYKSLEQNSENDIYSDDTNNKSSLLQNGLNNILLDDLVIIMLKNEDVVSGRLVAKSLNVIIVKTEAGSLTIPKRDIQKIEYLSSEYAERGEVVIAHLANQTHFEGNIYFEDSKILILDTKIGRLTIDKMNLRSLEYTGRTGQGDESLLSEYANAKSIQTVRTLTDKRLDMLSLGYSPSFGASYETGFGIGYTSKFLISQMEGFYIAATGGLNLNYFLVNNDFFKDEIPEVTSTGGTFISTFSAGASFTLYQQASSKYEFYIAPQVEANIVYKSLKSEYPSFPSFDSKISTTDFIFGIGNKIGLDLLFDNMKIGVSYNAHFLFGDEDFNTISLNLTQKLF